MKIKEAHHDYLDAVQHSERRYCLVVDYCQNAQLPNLGATQPGDTYYMTPLTIAILGIVDCSLEGGSLDAFAYHEGIVGKGGDNVASMIVMLSKHKGWMKENEVGGELTVLMDNCGGQNKNNHVLRLENLLVEAGRIFTVESDAPTAIKIWQDCLGTADVSVQDLQKHVTVDRDRIKEIKQIEMYTKWRKLVSAEFVNIICPYPGDEVMWKFKEERNRKARERTQRKRDTNHPTTKQKTQ
eukprot:jgi/Psemu1/44976/gm1.44976_g